jgi:hypothetical protein
VLIAQDLSSRGVLMSTGIMMIAFFLGLRQWYESRARERDLSDLDRSHFARQDLRRGVGVAVMLMLAFFIWIGARIEPKIAGKANLTFLEVWLAVVVLIMVLLFLALMDWLATRTYARRLRRSLARERVELLREVFGRSPSAENEPPAGSENNSDQR